MPLLPCALQTTDVMTHDDLVLFLWDLYLGKHTLPRGLTLLVGRWGLEGRDRRTLLTRPQMRIHAPAGAWCGSCVFLSLKAMLTSYDKHMDSCLGQVSTEVAQLETLVRTSPIDATKPWNDLTLAELGEWFDTVS